MTAPSDSGANGGRGRTVSIGWPAIVRFALVLVLIGALLFISAGTTDWPMAWVYLVIYLLTTVVGRYVMFRKNPELFKERAEYDKAEGVESWDRWIMPIVAIYGPMVGLIVAGLNHRFGWAPELPLWLQFAALVVLFASMVIATWATLANRFFAAVVRIQTERGHTTITAGPYRYVRHPGYASGIAANLVTPLALGAPWALVPGIIVAGLTVLRTVLEDRTLQAKLPGYSDYAKRVRYRLLPGVW